jgi:putative transposase
MDESHLMAAFRYVALNPVEAKLSKTAADWPWSSRPADFRRDDDGLVTVSRLLDRVENLAKFLAMEPDPELEAALLKGRSIGRPLMNDQELLALELRLGRPIRPGKRSRPASTEP